VTPGAGATEQLAKLVADTTLPNRQRDTAVGALGWRKDVKKEQKDAALAFLLPRLNDAKTRSGAATILHPRYVASHGLWHKDPRVLEAAKAALAAEQAKPQPDKTFVALLEKIAKGQQ
jgi:hypothetical protein